MSRLFELKKPDSPSEPADAAKRVRAALAAAELDDNARKLGELLSVSQTVTPVHYMRDRHGRWLIEHGRAGDDYLYQMHPLRVPTRAWQDVLLGFIVAMDSVFPLSIKKRYRLPDEEWQIRFFTITVEKVCALPGWEIAVKKVVDALARVDAWTSGGGAPGHAEHPTLQGKRIADEGAG